MCLSRVERSRASRAEQRASTMTTTTTTDGMMAAVPNETVERMYIKREKKTVPGALNALNGGKVLTYISPWKVKYVQ